MQAIRRRYGTWPLALTVLALFAIFVISDGISPPTVDADANGITIITVNSNADTTVDDGNCTLREAIIAANTNTASGAMGGECVAGSDPDTITFNADFVIAVTGTGALPNITNPVTIDGSTQVITLDGAATTTGEAGLTIVAGGDGSTIKGLNIFGFADNGISIINSGGNTIGGTTAAERNVIGGNRFGVKIFNPLATGNVVKGNYIGTDVTGTADMGNTFDGVLIQKAPNNTIGGTTAAERNVISGNDRHGVLIFSSSGGANSNTVQGNFIGTKADGTSPLGNNSIGVSIAGFGGTAINNTVGGTGANQANTIAFNSSDGVRVEGSTAINNPIRGNSIHSNTGLGINNTSGGNTQLAAPTITSLTATISGTACANCFVDVYSDAADEGRVFEGTTMATAGGAWSLTVTPTDPNVTATATDGSNNTSEFSPLSACQIAWPGVTVNTDAKGQSPTNNPKVQHAITGHIVDPTALGPKAHRIRICEGTALSISISDSTGTPTNTALSAPGITCNSSGCTVTSLTKTEKYKAVSNDGKDTDRVTLLPGSGYGD